MLIMLVVHGQEWQLIIQSSSRHKSIPNICIMAKDVFLYKGTENIGNMVVYRKNNVLFQKAVNLL